MSTRTVSTLNIQMHADTATASEQIRTFGDRAKSALDDVKKHAKTVALGIGAVASAAAVAVASVTKEHIQLANELQKTARIANTTATEIQKYTFAAKAMGIEQDKLGDIFKDTQDKVGDFLTTGGGEMLDFFENIAPQIGITAKEFRNLSGADALQLYYTSLEKANLSQSEMIFYMESVADEASLLIPLLANGGEGFKLWSDMAQRAGAVMSEETLVATQKLTASTEIMKELDEANLSELALIKARYELERREMALSNHSLKDEMIAQSHRDEASEIGQLQKGHRDSTTGLFADLTGNSNLLQVQQEYQARKQIIDEALANEAISFAEHHAMLGVLERTAYESRRQVIAEGMQGVAGSLTQITGDLLGKQSKAYRVMFVVEKGFAIARSVMAIQTGIAQAAALPFPANFPAMASVISATASIISTLQSVRQPIGQAHDGIMSVPESGTWNLQKGERVLPQYTAKRLDKTLDNLQGGQGVQVVINNYTSSNVETTTDDDGKLKILITNEINKQVPSQLANPNSPISKGLKNNWQVAPKR